MYRMTKAHLKSEQEILDNGELGASEDHYGEGEHDAPPAPRVLSFVCHRLSRRANWASEPVDVILLSIPRAWATGRRRRNDETTLGWDSSDCLRHGLRRFIMPAQILPGEE